MKYKVAQEEGNSIVNIILNRLEKVIRISIDDYSIWNRFLLLPGHFDQEIVSVSVPGRKGTTTLISKDENPRPETTKESLSKLRPAFIRVH